MTIANEAYDLAVVAGLIRQSREALHQAIEHRRLLIQQAREAGMTLDEIAEQLGVTRAAVIAALAPKKGSNEQT